MCVFVCVCVWYINISLTWEVQSKFSCISLSPDPPSSWDRVPLVKTLLFGLRQLLSKVAGSTYLFKKLLNFTQTNISTLTAVSLAFGFLFKSPYLYLDLEMVFSLYFPLTVSKFWNIKDLCSSLNWKTQPLCHSSTSR